MRHVNALWAELTRSYLTDCAQAKLTWRKVDVARSAKQARRGANQNDCPALTLSHDPRSVLSNDECAQAVRAPSVFERCHIGIEEGRAPSLLYCVDD